MTAPKLAIDGGEKVGRLYRRPGQPLPDAVRTDAAGYPFLRHRDAVAEVRAGRLVPSITNVLGVRSAPHLLPWTAKKVAEEAVSVSRSYPTLIAEKPTDALAHLRGAADRDRDAAAAQGDAVHQACEALATGLPRPSMPDQQGAYVDAWQSWADRWQPEFVGVETTVFGRVVSFDGTVRPYAGTCDFIIRVNGLVVAGDIKTTRSGLHADLAGQLAAIVHAEEMTTDGQALVPMVDIDAAIGLHLSPEGYQVRPVDVDGQVWDLFRSLREAWDFHVCDGGLRDGSHALGRVLAYPDMLLPRPGRALLTV